MDKKSTLIIVGVCALGAIGFLVILFTRSSVDTTTPVPSPTTSTEPIETPTETKEVVVTSKTVVTAKHAYINGAHVIAGELPLPSACHILEASGRASTTKQVLITLISSVKTDETCAESITPARFKVSVKALKSAKITATLNGQDIILNLIEAVPDENLDNFELYIKG